MTSFEGKTETAETAKTTEPAEPAKLPAKIIPPSRVKETPELWTQASEFADMLTYCRPDRSRTEGKFIAKYLFPLGVSFDKKGNIYKQIGDNPIVLWSSHVDTVHSTKGFQKIEYWMHKTTGELHFKVAEKSKSSCLGGDDTCGIWLMVQMIRANIPGLYIFHRGEEVGRIGSKWIAEHNKDALKGIKFAIAFDRRGEKSIITYQNSARCCSDEFAKSLGDQLGMGHACDTGGSYTDTASYVDLVAECTNISAGYQDAHCKTEYTNVDYLFRLRDALLKIDVSKLVENRKPGENTRLYQSYSYHSEYENYGWDWYSKNKEDKKDKVARTGGLTGIELRERYNKDGKLDWFDDYEFDSKIALWFPKDKNSKKKDLGVTKVWRGSKDNTLRKPTYNDMVRMIRMNPEIIADLLESYGYDPSALRAHMFEISEVGNVIHL